MSEWCKGDWQEPTKGVDKMKSGWETRRRQPGGRAEQRSSMNSAGASEPSDAERVSEREGHLRAVARMHRPKLAKRKLPPGDARDVARMIQRTELLLALLKDGGATPELAVMGNLRDIEHSAEDNDELILCRTLGGYVIETPKGMLVSYNPQSAQTIPEWPERIALEPEGMHALCAYKNNITTIYHDD
jgi:hypothetical protein